MSRSRSMPAGYGPAGKGLLIVVSSMGFLCKFYEFFCGVATMGRGICGTGSGFRVVWRAAGGVWFLFFGEFLLVLAGLLFWRGAGRGAIVLWDLDDFLIFPNFLRSQVLSCSAACEATPIYHI